MSAIIAYFSAEFKPQNRDRGIFAYFIHDLNALEMLHSFSINPTEIALGLVARALHECAQTYQRGAG
ncbi:MAG: hypothetical protein AAF220_00625 [Pseudomonadota bacterium]